MDTHPDDPKLTAFALGELVPAEAETLDQHVRECGVCRQAVEDTRGFAKTLSDEFEKEPIVERSISPRMLMAKHAGMIRTIRRRRWPWMGVSLVSAAALLIAVGVSAFVLTARHEMTGARSGPKFDDLAWYEDQDMDGAPDSTKVDLGPTSQDSATHEAPAPIDPVGLSAANVGDNVNALMFSTRETDTKFAGGKKATRRRLAPSFGGTVRSWNANGVVFDRFQRTPLEGRPAEVDLNAESYDQIADNPFREVGQHPLSTFSIDVDTASYANVRRFISQGAWPPRDAVRIEELLNYFTYRYPQPEGDTPFATHVEVGQCPWNLEHRLMRVGLKGREIAEDRRPASNLVFLLDVSGSMDQPNKLPLVKAGMKLLVNRLGENDRVAIVVYAGASGMALRSTTCDRKETVLQAIDVLNAGGSTNGAAGIQLAYDLAQEHFITGGTNRVILCTDGDFNVGITDQGSLVQLIEQKASGGVFLSVLGFGMGNLKDSTLEKLADRGNGNYAYIDSLKEARKVLVEQMGGTLVTIAKDVKIQIEFNPAQVASYRLIGYENRVLAAQDFNDDKKDAGEIGAGHTVTALYEVVPVGKTSPTPGVDPLKYQQPAVVDTLPNKEPASKELLTVKLRYKEPTGQTSKLLEYPIVDAGRMLVDATADFRFAAAVAEFGMQLRESPHKGSSTLDSVLALAEEGLGDDREGYRTEFVDLVRRAKQLRH